MGTLFVIKPVSYTSKNLLGGVITMDTDDFGNSVTDSSSAVLSDVRGDVGTRAHIGFPNTPSDTDWSESGSDLINKDILVLKISAIGSNYSPTISQLNQHVLITEYWHSNHSNSVNGNDYRDTVGDYDFDESTLTIDIAGADTISFANYSTGVATTQSHTNALRSWDATTNHYFNGILVGSNYGGGSSETEWWEIQQTADASEQTTQYVTSNNDNLIDSTQYYPRTDVTFVKKALTGAKTDDARDNALAFILAHLETNGDKKKLPQRYRKIRTALNISSIETLENDYRTHSA